MANTVFLKGSDFAVEVNGRALGGVISAEVEEKKSFYDVREFLSGSAVESVESKSNTITLTVNISKDNLFSGDVNILSLALVQGDGRTEFRNIRVLSVTDKCEGGNKAVRVIRLFSEGKVAVL